MSRIESKNGGDGEKCCREALMMWLQGKGRLCPWTWGKLHEALTEIEAKEAAKSIEENIFEKGIYIIGEDGYVQYDTGCWNSLLTITFMHTHTHTHIHAITLTLFTPIYASISYCPYLVAFHEGWH